VRVSALRLSVTVRPSKLPYNCSVTANSYRPIVAFTLAARNWQAGNESTPCENKKSPMKVKRCNCIESLGYKLPRCAVRIQKHTVNDKPKLTVRFCIWRFNICPETKKKTCGRRPGCTQQGRRQAWVWRLSPRKMSLSPQRETDWSRIEVKVRKFSNFDSFCSQNM